ncbi:MAG: metallophosphoesterase family protein [Candidatus Asgardarchaeia archaeon]
MTKVVIVSDIHGNLEAFNAVLNDCGNYDEFLFLGDAVDYGPNPAEVIDLLKSLGARSVMGNHDKAVAYKVDCRCSEELHDLSVYTRENISNKLLTESDVSFLRKMRVKSSFYIDSLKIYMVHASPKNPLYGYIWPWLDEEEIEEEMKETTVYGSKSIDADMILLGHTHYQFKKELPKMKNLLINPGSVGQPRDGDRRAGYAILIPDEPRVIFRRVKYNVENVLKEYKRLDLERKYLERLRSILLNGRI